MIRRKQPREIEEKKTGWQNRNQNSNNDKLSDFPDCILLHILSFLNAKDAAATCLLSTRWKHLWRSLPTKDTLSNLPDSILLHVLSFLNAKYAVQTCLLSTRWKHLWRRLPTINFLSSHNFRTGKHFANFVNRFLSLRISSTPLNALDFQRRGCAQPCLLNTVVRYALSHNVNRLRLSYHSNHFPFPSSSSCASLTSLELCSPKYSRMIFPNSLSLNFPALTYLKLCNFSFCTTNDGPIEPFSTFNNLNTLILLKCNLPDPQQPLCISSAMLLNLSISTGYKHCSYNPCYSKIELFAPSLCTFAVTCSSFLNISGSHLSSIKQVSIVMYPMMTTMGMDIHTTMGMDIHNTMGMDILNWFIDMTHIESLTVCPQTLKALSLVINEFKLRLPSLCNLKSVQLNVSPDAYGFSPSSWRDIKMELVGGKSWIENAKLREAIKAGLIPRYSSIIDQMIEFLLQNSPSAKVDVVTH